MRQVRVKKQRIKSICSSKEPLTEGIVRKKRRLNGFFSKMSDNELVEYAQKIISEKKINKRRELAQTDSGLYGVLRKRGLLEKVQFKFRQKQRPHNFFKNMGNDDLVKYAQGIIDKKKIIQPTGLRDNDRSLYYILRSRNLLSKMRFKSRRRPKGFFTKMTDRELVKYAQKIIDKGELEKPKDLVKADSGLYVTLRNRRLLEQIKYRNTDRPRGMFRKMNDEEFVKYAQRIIDEKKVKKPFELNKIDKALYSALYKRGLLRKVNFQKKRITRPYGFFTKMSDEELTVFAKKFIEEKELKTQNELKRIDSGLYSVLFKRKLFNRVFNNSKNHDILEGLSQAAEAMEQFGSDS